MADGSATVPGATTEAAGSSGAEARVADAALEAGAEKSTMPKEHTALPKASKGVVGHDVRPPSPLVVPLAVEEDKVEETKCEEARP